MDFINNNLDKPWNWIFISMNKFKFNKKLRIIKQKYIYKFYRNFKFIKFIKICSLKYKLKNIIEYLPLIGIKYFEGLNSFNELLNT